MNAFFPKFRWRPRKKIFTKSGTLFSPISSGHLRSDAYQSQTIGADADLDHIQTIGWDTVKLLKDISPPSPSSFDTSDFRPAPFMNLGCNKEKLTVVDSLKWQWVAIMT